MESDYQLSRLCAAPGETVRLRAEGCETVFLVRQGEGVCRWISGESVLGTECVLILHPGGEAELRCTGGTAMDFWRLKLTPRLLRNLSDDETDLCALFSAVPQPCAAARLFAQRAALLQRQLMLLEAEASDEPAPGRSVMRRALLELCVVQLLRDCAAEEWRTALVGRRRLAVEEVFSYISAHLDEPLELRRLAAQFYVSPEHLSRQFRKQTGQTLHQYILRTRLARCRSLLCDGVPLSAIWPQCGFSSYNVMLRAFKRHFGVSPTEYYRQCRLRAVRREQNDPPVDAP